MDEKTSLWVKMPAGPAYKVAKFSEFWSKFYEAKEKNIMSLWP